MLCCWLSMTNGMVIKWPRFVREKCALFSPILRHKFFYSASTYPNNELLLINLDIGPSPEGGSKSNRDGCPQAASLLTETISYSIGSKSVCSGRQLAQSSLS